MLQQSQSVVKRVFFLNATHCADECSLPACAGDTSDESLDFHGDLHDLEECSSVEEDMQAQTVRNNEISFNEQIFNTADSSAPFLQPNSFSSDAHIST